MGPKKATCGESRWKKNQAYAQKRWSVNACEKYVFQRYVNESVFHVLCLCSACLLPPLVGFSAAGAL